jgi:hypothetical protein
LGEGKLSLTGGVEVVGGQSGWQAFGTGVIGIGTNLAKPTIATLATGPSLRALGPGATITVPVSSDLVIGAATTIELGGNDRAVGGEIILKNSSDANITTNGKLTLSLGTSKITTGNTASGTQPTAVLLAPDYVTAATGTTISKIGVPYLAGDGSYIKVTPTVVAVDSKVPAGRLISLEGGGSSAAITGGDDSIIVTGTNDGRISSLTPTNPTP